MSLEVSFSVLYFFGLHLVFLMELSLMSFLYHSLAPDFCNQVLLLVYLLCTCAMPIYSQHFTYIYIYMKKKSPFEHFFSASCIQSCSLVLDQISPTGYWKRRISLVFTQLMHKRTSMQLEPMFQSFLMLRSGRLRRENTTLVLCFTLQDGHQIKRHMEDRFCITLAIAR